MVYVCFFFVLTSKSLQESKSANKQSLYQSNDYRRTLYEWVRKCLLKEFLP